MTTQNLTSRAIIGEFYDRLETGTDSYVNSLAMNVRSDQESEEYKWLGMVPNLREMKGGRQAKGLRDEGQRIKNKSWESTLEVDIDDLRRDKTGQTLIRIREMADRANGFKGKLISDLIIGGASTACYDGQYFFDTDHSSGDSGQLSNKISVDISALATGTHGSTTAPSAGEMQLSILQGIQAFYGFLDDQGEPLNEGAKNFLVMVPPSLWAVTASALKNATIDQGDTNVLANIDGFSVNYVANARLGAWTDKFAIFRTDGVVKPFIFQEEVPLEMSAIAEGSELEFKHRKHQYGAFMSGNAGYGYWQHAVQVTLA